MPVERRGWAITLDGSTGAAQPAAGGSGHQWKAAAFAWWREPDDARVSTSGSEGLGVNSPCLRQTRSFGDVRVVSAFHTIATKSWTSSLRFRAMSDIRHATNEGCVRAGPSAG